MNNKFIQKWQEPLVWLPIVSFALGSLFFLLPKVDPKSGVDGFGFLYDATQASLILILVFFFAWLYRHTYGAANEEDLVSNAKYIKENHPVIFYWTEKAYQIIILLVVYFSFKH